MSQFVSRYVWILGAVLAACGGDDGAKESSTMREPATAGKSGGDTLVCGAETCELPAELEGESLCCKDQFAGGCGVKVNSDCRPLPDVDERCPPPKIMVNIPGASEMKVFGCCTSAGECGTDFGMGCQPRTIACMVVTTDQVDQIKHQKCTGEPLPLPQGCGMTGLRIPGVAGSGG